MKSFFSAARADTRARYFGIGVTAFIVELAVLFAAQAAGAPGILGVTISFFVGLCVSFLLQKTIAFKDRRFHKKILMSQTLLYVALVICNFGFTIAAVWALENYFPVALIRTVVLATTVVGNYYLYRTWIFNSDRHP